jgi:hypothetical protein
MPESGAIRAEQRGSAYEHDFGRNGSSTTFLCRWADADRLPDDWRIR